MPGMEKNDLHQKAMYWAAAVTHGNYGEVELSSPVEISVRWENNQREEATAQGNTVMVVADVVVDRVVPVGSILWLGTQAAYNSLSTGPVLYQVMSVKDIPDVKNRATRRTVMVSKYSKTLPSLA